MKAAVLALIALAFTTTIVIAPALIASADHDDSEPNTYDGGPAVGRFWRAGPGGKALPPLNKDGFRGVPAIVRNLVTLNSSGAIPVCATSQYAVATQQALAGWNNSLRTNTVLGENIFRFEPGGLLCAPSTTGPLQAIVVYASVEGQAGDDCPPGGVACFQARFLTSTPNFTYFGVAAVLFDEGDFAALTPEFWNRGPLRTASEAERRVSILAHEFGHSLGLRHGWEETVVNNRCLDPGPPPANLVPGVIHQGPCSARNVGPYDNSVYSLAYAPGKVTGLRAQRAATTAMVRLTWNAADVHVEKGFEIQVGVLYESGDTVPGFGGVTTEGWETIAEAPANADQIEIPWPRDNLSATVPYRVARPSGAYATYRVVSTTDAFGSRLPASDSVSAPASHAVERSYTVARRTPTTVISGAIPGAFTSTVQWYATISCRNGPTFTIGPAATAAQITTDATFALIACYATRSQRESLDFSGTLTRSQIESALQGVSYRVPKMAQTVDASAIESRGGRFSISRNDAGEHAAITCDSGTAFSIGPAETQDEILSDAVFALTICANADMLSSLDLSQPLTRAALEEAIERALAASSQSDAQVREVPAGTETVGKATTRDDGHGFTITSETVWSWSGTCRVGGATGSGSATSAAAATSAFQNFSRSCPTQVVTGATTWRYEARVMCWGGELKTDSRSGYRTNHAAAQAAETWLDAACD